jgi:hypothetical protein
MYPQKVIPVSRKNWKKKILVATLKVTDENSSIRSRIRAGSESVSQRYGSVYPDP